MKVSCLARRTTTLMSCPRGRRIDQFYGPILLDLVLNGLQDNETVSQSSLRKSSFAGMISCPFVCVFSFFCVFQRNQKQIAQSSS